ncbi:hypothetical protein AB7C87_17145 [Natrarchaeobius sp. A-rgal3]|uniref:hypothetical protein n=1 Tax=Natrarchaeobius versutus TaxID=1679078 RepID=UPI0035105A15
MAQKLRRKETTVYNIEAIASTYFLEKELSKKDIRSEMRTSMTPQQTDVAIVGLGPAGIGVVHRLLEQDTDFDIACFDLGPRPEEKNCAVLNDAGCIRRTGCHILTGFGGSSLLSGGKLSTLPAGDSLIDITEDTNDVERTITEALAFFNDYLAIAEPTISPEEIEAHRLRFEDNGFDLNYYDAHVMIESEEKIRQAYCEMCKDLESARTSFHFNTKVVRIEETEDHFTLYTTNSRGEEEKCVCNNIILGVGLSGDVLLENLQRQFDIQTKPSKLEMGVRLEFPRDVFPEIDQGHKDLKLHRGNCRTFCVCKGGQLAPYFHDSMSLLDGHVDRTNLTDFTNLGLRLRLPSSKDNDRIYSVIRENYLEATSGIPIRESYTSYVGNANKDIMTRDESSINYWKPGDINNLFPEKYAEELRQNVIKFVDEVIPEKRHSEVNVYAPGLYYPGFEFEVNRNFEVSDSMYIIGEGTGQFRGILQAFSSGLLCAESIAEKLQ